MTTGGDGSWTIIGTPAGAALRVEASGLRSWLRPAGAPTLRVAGIERCVHDPGDRLTKVVSGDVVPTYVSQRGFGLAVLTGRSTRPLWPAALPVLAGTAIGELLRVQNRDETRYWHCRCHIPGLAAPGWDHVAMASSPSAAT